MCVSVFLHTLDASCGVYLCLSSFAGRISLSFPVPECTLAYSIRSCLSLLLTYTTRNGVRASLSTYDVIHALRCIHCSCSSHSRFVSRLRFDCFLSASSPRSLLVDAVLQALTAHWTCLFILNFSPLDYLRQQCREASCVF